jgi:hypothetical protein
MSTVSARREKGQQIRGVVQKTPDDPAAALPARPPALSKSGTVPKVSRDVRDTPSTDRCPHQFFHTARELWIDGPPCRDPGRRAGYPDWIRGSVVGPSLSSRDAAHRPRSDVCERDNNTSPLGAILRIRREGSRLQEIAGRERGKGSTRNSAPARAEPMAMAGRMDRPRRIRGES